MTHQHDDAHQHHLQQRCADGRPCLEVIDRLKAADLAECEFPVQAGQLRAKARLWAALHHHGAPSPLEGFS